jgi:DNA-binding beta-propeller fold protein YncE
MLFNVMKRKTFLVEERRPVQRKKVSKSIHNCLEALEDYLLSDVVPLVLEYLSVEEVLIKEWELYPEWESIIPSPDSITVSSNGREIFITRYNEHQIQVFSPEGYFLRQWELDIPERKKAILSAEELTFVHERNEIYLTDSVNHQILVFSPQGKLIAQWNRYGNGVDESFNQPKGLAVVDSKIYIADRKNRLQVFALENDPKDDKRNNPLKLRFLQRIGEAGPAIKGLKKGQLGHLTSVAVSPARREIYLADQANYIHVFSLNGVFLRRWGPGERSHKQNIKDDSLNEPLSVAFHRDEVYVIDSFGRRIQVFTPFGEFIRAVKVVNRCDCLVLGYNLAVHDDKIYLISHDDHHMRIFQQRYN